jgi:hypothetical protein
MIPIDFVAGCHGHFLETVLNKYFGIVEVDDTFTATGTSHRKNNKYEQKKLFSAQHWFELYSVEYFLKFDKIISIKFDIDDLLLVSSVSLLRAGDMNIDNDSLEFNTKSKLDNRFYKSMLNEIYAAYPEVDQQALHIPRNVLREFFKFGFRNPEINGYWRKLLAMQYPQGCKVFYFDFKSFYDVNLLVQQLEQLEVFLGMRFDFSDEFFQHHEKFLSFIPYVTHQQTCDHIVECVRQEIDVAIPNLTLFQESYINGNLERIHGKEMPFLPNSYFNSTLEMLYYIKNQAPNL